MKFDETKLNDMKVGSRQYLDQQERVLFGQARSYRQEESTRKKDIKVNMNEINEKAIWIMKKKGVGI